MEVETAEFDCIGATTILSVLLVCKVEPEVNEELEFWTDGMVDDLKASKL